MQVPPEIEAQAVILGGERAFPAIAAANLVNFLSRQRIAVVGVELWLPQEGNPHVIGFSEYEVNFENDWTNYVEENGIQALKIIRGNVPAGCLFNLTWITEDEARKAKDQV